MGGIPPHGLKKFVRFGLFELCVFSRLRSRAAWFIEPGRLVEAKRHGFQTHDCNADVVEAAGHPGCSDQALAGVLGVLSVGQDAGHRLMGNPAPETVRTQ